MTRYSGKDLVVMVENSSSSEVALTFVVSADITYEYEKQETAGDTKKGTLAGQLVGAVDIEYEYDDTGTTGNEDVLAGIIGDNTNPRFVRVRPIGTGVGKTEFAMDSVLLSFNPPGVNRGNPVMGRAHFETHPAASAAPTWAAQT